MFACIELASLASNHRQPRPPLRYHDDDTFAFFIHNPRGQIGNDVECDLEGHCGELKTRLIIASNS